MIIHLTKDFIVSGKCISIKNAFKAGAANAGRDIQRHKRSGLKALVVKNVADKYSRKNIEALEEVAKTYKAKGLAWMKVNAEGKTSFKVTFVALVALAALETLIVQTTKSPT